MPNDPTAAARNRRYRERQAERLPPAPRIPCQTCGTLHTGKHDPWCQRCWLKLTPEGRADVAERVRRSRARKRRRQADDNL
jgi:hypothetical protein